MKPRRVSGERLVLKTDPTKVDPRKKCMDKIPSWVSHISKRQKIQLLVPTAAQNMNWDEHRPDNATSHTTYNAHHLQISKEEESIE